jgi:tetraacyldisaccharide-1-P 4'-kinase
MNDIEAHFDEVKVEDGDVLVITSPRALTRESADRVREAAMSVIDRLGVEADVLVLDNGLQAALLKTSQLQQIDPEPPMTA